MGRARSVRSVCERSVAVRRNHMRMMTADLADVRRVADAVEGVRTQQHEGMARGERIPHHLELCRCGCRAGLPEHIYHLAVDANHPGALAARRLDECPQDALEARSI